MRTPSPAIENRPLASAAKRLLHGTSPLPLQGSQMGYFLAINLGRSTGIEPATQSFRGSCSATELQAQTYDNTNSGRFDEDLLDFSGRVIGSKDLGDLLIESDAKDLALPAIYDGVSSGRRGLATVKLSAELKRDSPDLVWLMRRMYSVLRKVLAERDAVDGSFACNRPSFVVWASLDTAFLM